MLVEPIQGEGGIKVPADDYLPKLREICNERNWLLIVDEVQTGNGRTGKYFCYQHSNILPDVTTTAKGLGNGIPIGACLANGAAAEILQPGNHGSTFGGNPLSCAAALSVIEIIESENLAERAKFIGHRIIAGLKHELSEINQVLDIRGRGCMIGIELDRQCKSIFNVAMKEGLIINVTADSVIRLLPPLIMTNHEVDTLVSILSPLIRNFLEDSELLS